MHITRIIGSALVAASVAAAQALIQPDSVDSSTKQSWCDSQISQCPLICSQVNHDSTATLANDCDADTLTYQCVCGNGQIPNTTEYSQTLPYFECTEANNQCVNACDLSDTACQADCRTQRKCGASDPRRYNTTDTPLPAVASPTLPAGVTPTEYTSALVTGDSDSGTSQDVFNGDTGAAAVGAALQIGRVYGTFATLALVFAGFAFLL